MGGTYSLSLLLALFLFIDFQREWGRKRGGRERDRNISLLFCLFMHSLVGSHICSDWGWNPQPWCLAGAPPPCSRLRHLQSGKRAHEWLRVHVYPQTERGTTAITRLGRLVDIFTMSKEDIPGPRDVMKNDLTSHRGS